MGTYMTHTHVYMDNTQHTHKTDTCKGTLCGYYIKHTHTIIYTLLTISISRAGGAAPATPAMAGPKFCEPARKLSARAKINVRNLLLVSNEILN